MTDVTATAFDLIVRHIQHRQAEELRAVEAIGQALDRLEHGRDRFLSAATSMIVAEAMQPPSPTLREAEQSVADEWARVRAQIGT